MSYFIFSPPTYETRDRLSQILMSAPISIDIQRIHIPLWSGNAKNVVEAYQQKGPYSAKFKHFKLDWDEGHEATQLVGILDSPELRQRAVELGAPQDVELKLVFLDHAPPLSRTNKSFIVSVSDTLVMKEWELFTFEKDILIQV